MPTAPGTLHEKSGPSWTQFWTEAERHCELTLNTLVAPRRSLRAHAPGGHGGRQTDHRFRVR